MRLGELQRVEIASGGLHLADTKNGERRSIPAHTRIQTCLGYIYTPHLSAFDAAAGLAARTAGLRDGMAAVA